MRKITKLKLSLMIRITSNLKIPRGGETPNRGITSVIACRAIFNSSTDYHLPVTLLPLTNNQL